MRKERSKIIYIPYLNKNGEVYEYPINMIKILERKYDVSGQLAEPLNVLDIIATKAVFLNWVEDKLNIKMMIQLYMYKLFGTKIIWVFHNKFPHQVAEEDKEVRRNMRWLANIASYIILHSKSSKRYIPNYNVNKFKAVYVPHIMFEKRLSLLHISELRQKYDISENDFVFTMFGMIKPYKRYEETIKAFKKLGIAGTKLILAGNSDDVKYIRFIKELCHECKDIILDIRYIPSITLDAIIGISDVIVIPYVNCSSMNSGVMIQAFSNERTVIIPNICMARDLASQGFFYGYKKDLEKVMLKAYKNGKEVNREMGKRAYEYVQEYNNEKIVSNTLYSMLERKNRKSD